MLNRHIIYTTSFLMDFIYAMVVGACAVYAVELNATSLQLGILGAIGPAGYVLTCIASGYLSDRISKPRLANWATAALIISCAGLYFSSTLWHLYIFFGLFNVFLGFYWPPIQMVIADSSHSRSMTHTLGNFCIFWSAGFIVGHIACGYVTEINSRDPFAISILPLLLIIYLITRINDNEASQKHSNTDFETSGKITASEKIVLWKRFLLASWAGNFAVVFAFGCVKMLFPKLALEVDAISKVNLGIILALLHVGQIAMFFTVRYWQSWQYNKTLYLVVQLGLIPGVLFIALTSNVLAYAAGMLLIGLSGGFAYTASIYYSVSRPPNTGNRTGLHEAIIGMGVLSGPLVGGIGAYALGLHAPYWISALMAAAMILLQIILLTRGVKSRA